MAEAKKYETPSILDFACVRDQVALINGKFDLPKASGDIMNVIRKEIQTAAKNIVDAMEKASADEKLKVNGMFLSDGLMKLQMAKDTLCCSVIICYAETDSSSKPSESASKKRRTDD